MDTKLFLSMLSDKGALELTKLKYKYGDKELSEYLSALNEGFYQELPLYDFHDKALVFQPAKIHLPTQSAKILMQQYENPSFSKDAMENEIMATLAIEQIDSTRESIRKILNGAAPTQKNEEKIYGIKLGLDYIADPTHRITEQNLNQLYRLAIDDFLDEENKLHKDAYYRDDKVFIVGDTIEHQGIDVKKLPGHMQDLLAFIQSDVKIDVIVKSIIAHYYLAYLHPYFDGNGRMARLLQLWILVQEGYTSAMFVPFSKYVSESKQKYYQAFSLVSENSKISSILDVTPFLVYFITNVIMQMESSYNQSDVISLFYKLLKQGKITEKEKDLFYFVLSEYAVNEFSTKQLEKDFKDVAYATVRGFVLKMEDNGIFISRKFSNRVKYRIK